MPAEHAFENARPVLAEGFDFAAVARDLGESEPETSGVAAGTQELSRLLLWLATPRATNYFGPAFARRLAVLAWVANPAAFQGASLSELARRAGVTPQALSAYAAQASRIFGLRNRSQRTHGRRFRASRAAQLQAPA